MANDNLHGHTILVIEAEPFIRLNLSNSLTAAGARVLSARNAGDALAVIERSELGAAILDFTLGETGCSEVYQRLVESGVPVVIHTSDPTVLVAEKCPNAPGCPKAFAGRCARRDPCTSLLVRPRAREIA